MQKARYELDPYNRLVLSGSRKNSQFPKFRKVVEGRFKTGANNELTYHVKSPVPDGESIPNQIRLKGAWSLTDSHNLRLTLEKSARETFGDELTLQGEILDVKKNSLLFAVTTRTKDNALSTYVLTLNGSWQADESNRLTFLVKKARSRGDTLTFNGAWEVDNNHRIIYNYEKADLVRKKRRLHTLTFTGYWDIKEPLRLSYVLVGGTDSSFDFRTSAGIFKDGFIKYELGIGLDGSPRAFKRAVKLYGRWALKKGSALTFEVEYEKGRARAIVFGGEAKLTDDDMVSFRLFAAPDGMDLGAGLELSRRILKGDGEAFLRISKSRLESAIYAGAAFRW